MARCETAIASIGIKILLSDLISQMNENNYTIVKEMLNNGFIEDENEYFHEVYSKIINNIPNDFEQCKEYLINSFKNNGSYYKSKFNNFVKSNLDNGCLLNKSLLINVKNILSIDRWGYNRDGSNCVSRPINFDLSINTEKYKDFNNIEIVFILGQHAG